MREHRWRVATLNIWNRQGPWAERVGLLRECLGDLDADVVGLQEVLGFDGLPSQAHELVGPLGWNVHYGAAWDLGGGLTFGNAIVSRHPLTDARVLPLPTPAGMDTRTVAFARVECPHGPMPAFTTHLTWQLHLGHVRCQQVRTLADYVAELAPTDGPPPVLLGDFNAEPDADEIRFLRGLTGLGGACVYFADCWAATRADAGYSYDRANAYALRAHEPSRRIDYCFVRGPGKHLVGEPLSCALFATEPRGAVWPSDHYGVVAEIHAAKRHHDPF